MMPAAGPVGSAVRLQEIDLLVRGITAEDVIQPQRAPVETGVETGLGDDR